jgi:hypothetical protein
MEPEDISSCPQEPATAAMDPMFSFLTPLYIC